MNSKEIKDGMTQGEWVTNGLTFRSADNPTYIKIGQCYVVESGLTNENKPIKEVTGHTNAEAICLAINNTFLLGIDPLKVGEMRDMLERCVAADRLPLQLESEISDLLTSLKLNP